MTMKVKMAVNSLMVIATIGMFSGIAYAQVGAAEKCNGIDDDGNGVVDEGLDCRQHYLSYRFQTPNFSPINVFLNDQFLQGSFLVNKPQILLNPVIKKVADSQGLVQTFPMTRPELHYIGYQLLNQNAAGFPGAFVNISNQFETSDIKVDQPRMLLAPSAKKRLPVVNFGAAAIIAPTGVSISKFPIPHAEHYLCYDVEPKTFQIPVGLADQFQARHFVVVERKHLCNPVMKEHSGRVFPADIHNKDNHLMCYRVIDPINKARSVIVRDQFGFRPGKAFEEKEICVPTTKTPPRCVVPDDGKGSPDLAHLAYVSDSPLRISNGLPEGSSLDIGMRMHHFTQLPGPTPPAPATDSFFDVFTELSLDGFGGLGDYHRKMCLPHGLLGVRNTPTGSIGSFDTEMLQLDLQSIGDPDFDLLRIVGGNPLPSPGHTTLTRMPDGNWAIDSFFDITYEMEFKTKPTAPRPLGGMSGSTTGTIRMHAACPLVPPPEQCQVAQVPN